MRQKLDALEQGILERVAEHKVSLQGDIYICKCGEKIATPKQVEEFMSQFLTAEATAAQKNMNNHMAIILADLFKELTNGTYKGSR